MEVVRFEGENRNLDTLKDLRHIKAVFSERPALKSYEFGDSLGIEKNLVDGSGILSNVEVNATDLSGKRQYSFSAVVKDGKLILINNNNPPGLVLLLQ